SPLVSAGGASILYGKDMDILIRNALILPMTASANDPRKFFRGSVAISGGRISSVLPATPDNGSDDRGTESENRSRRVIDAGGKLLMPGLINLHNHVAMSLMELCRRPAADGVARLTGSGRSRRS
ncbi:MAG: hypothetical protein ACLTTP_09025, partial [Alistipes ihumii]